MAFHEHEAPHSGIALHGKHPRLDPKEPSLTTGRILLRRAQQLAGAPVAGFVTALHTPDLGAVADFLRVSVEHDIHLAWIIPDRRGPGSCGGRWFGDNVEAAAAWATSHNALGRNVYWTVNAVRPGLHKKPGKDDITLARFVHVDIDPPKDGSPFDRAGILRQLERLDPCLVVDSGGGLQAFWRLDPPCEDLQAIEATNLQARNLFGADACQNIDRLMRIPGTINWPDRVKRERGRIPALAGIVSDETGEAAAVDQLRSLFGGCEGKQGRAGSGTSLLEELGISPRCQPLHRLAATDPRRRSEEVLHAAGEMLRRGFDDVTIVRVLLDPALFISGHCLDQVKPSRAAERAIARAHFDQSAS